MKRIIIAALLVVTILSLGSAVYISKVAYAESQNLISEDQQQIVDEITQNLLQQGVPVVSSQIKVDSDWNPSVLVEYTLQSSSENDKVSSDDPIYSNIIGHEVNFAQLRGLNVGAIGVVIINSQAKVIVRNIRKVTDKEFLSTTMKPSEMNSDELAALLENVPAFGMYLDKVVVSQIEDGTFKSTFNIKAADVDAANSGMPGFMEALRSNIMELNRANGAQISSYIVDLSDAKGSTLLKYINDLQVGRQSWWQSDDLTQDWYPHPPKL